MDKFYTGVGSRKTPESVLSLMTDMAEKFAELGYTLRSGGAEGADRAFEIGAGKLKQIYTVRHATKRAAEIAGELHPAWGKCSEFARKLHARNVFQVMGEGIDTPSELVVCWTKDGCVSHETRCFDTGGTGTAISVACKYGVPILNLAIPSHFAKATRWVSK